MPDIRTIELLFLLLLLFIIAFGQLASKLHTPYPIVMVIGGLLLGLVPGIPRFTLDPDLIFLIVLPPLLNASSWNTSWRDFRFHLASILMLAFGLVGFTVIGVALAAPHVLTGFDWRLGLLLGAVVAPTDAIAATSIASRIGLPSRIVDILEGESLINDATGLLALEFAIELVVSRHVPTFTQGLLTFLWLVIGGIAVGLILGKIIRVAERYIDDAPLEITLSILIPYVAYLIAEAVHSSGVLAVVACGLYLTRHNHSLFSPGVRIQVWSFWESFTFLLNGIVFVLIGLQLPIILDAIRGSGIQPLLIEGGLFSLVLIALRLIWIYPSSYLAHLIRQYIDHRYQSRPSPRQTFIIGWTGMRGVVSLAAALSLPAVMANGNAFPQRNTIVFLTFIVILVTLVLQGITLAPLVRLLGIKGASGPNCEEQEARRIVIEAAVAHLESARERYPEHSEQYDDLVHHYHERLAALRHAEEGSEYAGHRQFTELLREVGRVERETAIDLRNQGRINDHVLRRIERELDLSESRMEAGRSHH